MTYNKTLRNIIGDVLTFLLACVINMLAYAVVYYVEKRQSDEGGFEIETDDLIRRFFATIFGSMVNVILIVNLIKILQ